MTVEGSVFEAFSSALSPASSELALPGDRTQIEALIDDAIRRGSEQWPNIVVAPAAFAAAIARSLAGAERPLEALAELHLSDLYLAQACTEANPAALAAFQATCTSTIEGSLRSLGLPDHVIADVAQEVREKLFVGRDGAPGKIATYSGRASLRSWLRTIATRTAVSLMRRRTEGPVDDEVMEALPSPNDGPDEQHFRIRYHSEFKAAFEAAIASLTPQQRNLLRHRFVDDLTVEAIGALYGVHKTTAFRWLESARELLAKRTNNAFQQQTRATPSEMRSIVQLLASNVELSLRRVLS